MDDLERCDRELADITAFHKGPATGERAFAGAIWLNDWEVEKRLIAKERAREVDMRDFNEPAKYIEKHYETDDTLCAVLLTRGKDGRATEVKHEFAKAQDMASPARLAHFRAANANGADVYLGVNTFHENAKSRTKADVKEVRHLFLDVDHEGRQTLAGILASKDLPKPSAVLQSSPERYQVLWRVKGFTPDQAENSVRGMAAEFGADPSVWDAARILRLPGFRNQKYFTKNWVHEVPGKRSQEILTPKEFPQYPEMQRLILPGQARQLVEGRHTPSERDWGRVLRKLESGEAPGVVRAWLAEQRPDKSNPTQYSQITVDNALKALQSRQRHSAGRSHGRSR